MLILDGKLASKAVKDALALQLQPIIESGKRAPHLAAILVGNNGASQSYVAGKVKNCAEVGFKSTLVNLDEQVTEEELLNTIIDLNNNDDIDGILVQLPLPKNINERKVIETIKPEKDVDGFHPINAGMLMQGSPTFIPATPYGILLMLEYFNIQTKGLHAVVIGRSNIVGRPMSILLSSNQKYGNCTATICHSHTQNLEKICLQGDINYCCPGNTRFCYRRNGERRRYRNRCWNYQGRRCISQKRICDKRGC